MNKGHSTMQKQSALFLLMLCLSFTSEARETLSDEQQLGKLLFIYP
jgi:hypothetical protein